jgi:hypothetical protein
MYFLSRILCSFFELKHRSMTVQIVTKCLFFLLTIVMIDSLKHLDFYPLFVWYSTIDLKEQLEKALNYPKCYQPCKQF